MGSFNEAAADCRGKRASHDYRCAMLLASMRPRLIAAENRDILEDLKRDFFASMRPRLIAAENGPDQQQGGGVLPASMRPRLIAAENDLLADGRLSATDSFNEAAADCRGKPLATVCTRMASESFNEAAADCRGKHVICTTCIRGCSSFNEAAADCRGKPIDRMRNLLESMGLQ